MVEFLNPVWFAFSRSIAISLSSSVRNLAVVGESGSRKSMTTPHRKVMIPKMMNSHCRIMWVMTARHQVLENVLKLTCHAVRLFSIWRIPTATKLPNIKDKEFPQNQIPWRSGCSDVLYQSEVIKVNPGERLASVHPRKKRATISPAKFVVAAWQARTTAHKMLYFVRANGLSKKRKRWGPRTRQL